MTTVWMDDVTNQNEFCEECEEKEVAEPAKL